MRIANLFTRTLVSVFVAVPLLIVVRPAWAVNEDVRAVSMSPASGAVFYRAACRLRVLAHEGRCGANSRLRALRLGLVTITPARPGAWPNP